MDGVEKALVGRGFSVGESKERANDRHEGRMIVIGWVRRAHYERISGRNNKPGHKYPPQDPLHMLRAMDGLRCHLTAVR